MFTELEYQLTMSFILESVCEWVMAHIMGQCLKLQVPDQVSRHTDPEEVYEYLFADGVRNWGRKVAYVTWLKESYGPIKGFLTLCKINRKRLR